MASSCSTATESLIAALETASSALKQGRFYLDHLSTEAQDARRERDEAIRSMQVSKKEELAWKEEAGTCKTALDHAEMKVQYQENIIAQLRRECTQWKDQSRNWQEHFLRVEQERCRLTLRLEELVAENQSIQAQRANAANSFPSNMRYHNVTEPPTSSTTTKRMSTSHESTDSPPSTKKPRLGKTPPSRVPLKQPPEAASKSKQPASSPHPAKRNTSMAATRQKRPLSPNTRQSPAEPRKQQVIRKVRAVIDIPVKEEDEEGSPELFPASNRAPAAPPTPAPYPTSARSLFRAKHDRATTWNVDYMDNERRAENSEGDSLSDEDEDDELRMGSEDDYKKLVRVRSSRVAPIKHAVSPKARRRSLGHALDQPTKSRKS